MGCALTERVIDSRCGRPSPGARLRGTARGLPFPPSSPPSFASPSPRPRLAPPRCPPISRPRRPPLICLY